MAESRKPTFAWNPRAGRWEFWVKDKQQPIVTIDGNGLSVNRGSLSYSTLAVGSLMSSDTLNVGGQGSIANLDITTGTMTNINVGTLATIRTINVGGQGSFANINVTTGTLTSITAVNLTNTARLVVGGGTISLITKVTGTIALAAVGTSTVGVATLTGVGSAGIAVGDLAFISPKAAISGVGIVGHYIPTTNVVNIYIGNADTLSAGSLPAVGVDVLVLRSA